MLPSVFDDAVAPVYQFQLAYVPPEAFAVLLDPAVNPSLSKLCNLSVPVSWAFDELVTKVELIPLTESVNSWLAEESLRFCQTQSGWNPTPVIELLEPVPV